MTGGEVTRIRVGNSPVGIIGLKEVFEETAGELKEKDEAEVKSALLTRLGKKNYIPDRAREEYGKAFLREFNKFLGRPFEEAFGGLDVKILGAGCTQCDGLEREVMEILVELDLAGNVEHVTDMKEIARHGVMGVPALVINGKVKSSGHVPPRDRIKQWLKEA